jgi:hypothetical protein
MSLEYNEYFIQIENYGNKNASNCRVRLAIFTQNISEDRFSALSPLQTRDERYQFLISANSYEEVHLCTYEPLNPERELSFHSYTLTQEPEAFCGRIYYIKLEASADELQKPVIRYYRIINSSTFEFTPLEIKPNSRSLRATLRKYLETPPEKDDIIGLLKIILTTPEFTHTRESTEYKKLLEKYFPYLNQDSLPSAKETIVLSEGEDITF